MIFWHRNNCRLQKGADLCSCNSLDFINIITDSFSPTRLINDAICEKSVYRAILGNGKDAAIEKVYNQQPLQEFLQQVSILSDLKHENVVELLGYCVHGDKRFLAYEFSHQSSLFDILHCCTSGRGLSWARKVKIAVGAAKGLEFIHKRGQVHCNIQSNNILLFNDSSVAKIAGFDLSILPIDVEACSHETIVPFSAFLKRVYSSPEYVLNGQLSSKTDVYSFGVVILELLTGRKPWDMQWLMAWAKHKDPVVARLKGNNLPFAGAAKMVEVAALCLREEADDRPSMSGVVQALQPLLE
ncbi:pto-interacting protein 1-like [Salvia splendens]|uniref:pto-interacting protein 1-like n=1 Tax=Salvia splendens TaxID=180675 RepID=UPI001100573F|nr:pto-interacting protein 1-like [Salvia splendens]